MTQSFLEPFISNNAGWQLKLQLNMEDMKFLITVQLKQNCNWNDLLYFYCRILKKQT